MYTYMEQKKKYMQCDTVELISSLYILVELKSSVRKFLTQFARDRRETQDYDRAPHGHGYKGVDGR